MASVQTIPAELLDAIAAQPEADAPRLALAQWWEQHGQPHRAECLRLQLALQAEPNQLYPATPRRQQRLRELTNAHLADWLRAEQRYEGVTFSLHRGLFERVCFDSYTAFERSAEAVFRERFVAQVTFKQLRSTRKLADSPLLAQVRELDLEHTLVVNADDLITLLRSPHLGALQSLQLPPSLVSDRVVEALAGCTHLTDLRRLGLAQAYYARCYSAATLQALLQAPHLGQLQALSLDRTRFSPAHARALFESPRLRHLRELSLEYAYLAPEGIDALGQADTFPALRVLSLNHNPLGDEGVRLLARASGLHSLCCLSLQHNLIGNAGMLALCQAGPWTHLQTLHLGANAIGDAGLEAFARSEAFPALVGVEFSGNRMSDEALWNLGRSCCHPNLRVVELHQVPARLEIAERVRLRFREGDKPLQGPMPEPTVVVPLRSAENRRLPTAAQADEDGLLQAILAAPEDPVPRLIYADWLEEQGEPDRAALLRCEGVPKPSLLERALPPIPPEYARFVPRIFFEGGLLTVTLQMRGLLSKVFQASGSEWLRRCRVFRLTLYGTTRDWSRVAAMPLLRQIRLLRVDPGSLKQTGLAGLLSSPHLGQLLGLEMPRASLNLDNRLELLLKASTLPNLCYLNLTDNQLMAPAMRLLSCWQPAQALVALNLSRNWIGADGLALLLQAPWCRHVTQLNVSGNHLTDRGLQVLLEAENTPSLTHLWISDNQITSAGLQALRSSRLLQQLHYLELGHNPILSEQLEHFLCGPELPPTIRIGVRYLNKDVITRIRERLGERLVLA